MVQNTNLTFVDPNTIIGNPTNNINGAGGGACWNSHSGAFKFYFDGWDLYDANFNLTPNGNIVNMAFSTNGSSVIIPWLNDTNKFFLFSPALNSGSMPNFTYSVINLNLNSGLGDVETNFKNIEISNEESQSIAATAHRDGLKAWVVSRIGDGSKLQICLVGDTILETRTDSILPVLVGPRVIKFSPNGKYLITYTQSNILSIIPFDNLTGLLSNPIEYAFDGDISAFCFSSHSTILYAIEALNNLEKKLVQVDLKTSVHDSITSTSIYSKGMDLTRFGYIFFLRTLNNVGIIQSPNQFGPSCNYIDSFFIALPDPIASSPPNFISNWTNRMFDVEQNCVSDSAQFYFAGYRMDSAVWDFGEPSSGVLNHGLGQEVKHLYADTGTYTVTLYATTGMQTDTIVQTVHIDGPLNPLVFSNDSFNLCFGDSLVLNAFQPEASSYLWQDSSNLDQLIAKDSGWYSVSIENGCGVVIDSIYVSIDDSIQLQPLLDTFFCEGDTLTLAAHTNENATWLWSNGNSTSKTQITANGNNEIETWVTATNACGSVSDTVIITILPQPNIAWFSDSILCNQALPVVTNPNTFGVEYTLLYNFNSSVFDTVFDWTIDTAGLYYLVAENRCDTLVRRAFLNPQQIIEKELLQSIALCPGEEVVLDAFWEGSSYAWSENVDATLLNDSAITVTSAPLSDQSGSLSDQTGTETYTVTITNPPCVRTLSTTVIFLSEDSCGNTCAFSVPNVFTPNQDGVNDAFRITNSCESQSFRFSIYNRWGTLVHSGAESIAYWDGTSNGAFVNSGVYFLIIEYTDSTGQEKTVKTAVSVLR